MTTRRMVLLGGVAAGGALIVGYALWPSHRRERENALAAGPDERFVSNWIKIANDGIVTVIVPHCDMGTGNITALTQMAAEELDADWSQMRGEQAPPDPLFANGALAEGFILSGQNIGYGQVPAFLRGLVGNSFRTIAEYKNLQITGGSSAVRFTGVYGMRVTGAAVREMLVMAASARWNVSPDACRTEKGRVFHGGKSFGYGELAAEAAAYTPSDNPVLKSPDKYTIVGRPVPRFDVPAKVNGTAQYGIDVRVPGMLYAALRIAPVFGAKLASVDSVAAEKMRGVSKVVKLDDAVVVVADRFWRAKNAVESLAPVWRKSGNEDETSARITAKRDALLKSGPVKSDVKTGAGADALAKGKLVEAQYSVPYLAHAQMEPVNATALFKDGTLEVWSGTQDGLGARAYCAEVAKLPLEKVTFHQLQMGGGFGRRLPGYFNFLRYAAQTAMAMPGLPVKLLFTREEDMQHDYYRPNVISCFRAALDGKGAPLAWVNDYTTEDDPNPEAHIVYDIPNQAIGAAKLTTSIPTGPWRSVEASWHGFFIESFVDELAHADGADPYAYRRTLLAQRPRHRAVLELAAQQAGWGTALPKGRARGIALFESFQTIVAEVAEVEVDDKGALTVHRVTAAVDAGTTVNPDGLRAQVEGGIIFGLGAVLNGAISIDKGRVMQANFPDYEMVKLADCPQIEVHLSNSDGPYGGGGEPGVPPLAPAITNAIFAATGARIRDLPVRGQDLVAAITHPPQKQTSG
ncbi:MAG: molybdopterin-dependent oxidoreductase [Alphaproteobacteria bacterium]|nr:molybdopterin-dependent oxidoreductase [Alphaproteobacteria bacterium]